MIINCTVITILTQQGKQSTVLDLSVLMLIEEKLVCQTETLALSFLSINKAEGIYDTYLDNVFSNQNTVKRDE